MSRVDSVADEWSLPALLLSLTCCHELAAKDRAQAPAPAATASAGVSARVVGIHDGDTLTVLIDGNEVKVRLEGIDAPEKGQAFGAKSKEALAFLLAGHAVRIVPAGKDRYGRTLARVTADGADVCVAMVRRGMAWHFTRYSKAADLAAAEAGARKAGLGLWADKAPLPPWEWRRPSKVPEK